MKKTLMTLLPLVVLVAAVILARYEISTRPEPQRTERTAAATPVEVVVARRETFRLTVDGMGTVRPARSVILRVQVTGRIVEQSPELVPGGLLKEGEVALRIDPADYELAVSQAEAEMRQVQSELRLEEGRQKIAQREWELLGADIPASEAGRDLALRKPQKASAEARLLAAQSRLDLARLNLRRTTVRAPFNALVQNESTEVGDLVTPQTALATLVGTDEFWVQVSLPVDRLPYVAFQDKEDGGRTGARVSKATGQGHALERSGRVVRLLGDLEPGSQLARVLVAVDDPLGLRDSRPPLLVGSYVQVDIDGGEMADVVPLPRAALRDGGRVWLINDGHLRIEHVSVVWKTRDTVLVASGVAEGDRVVTSLLNAPVPGMALRIADGEAVQDEPSVMTAEGVSP